MLMLNWIPVQMSFNFIIILKLFFNRAINYSNVYDVQISLIPYKVSYVVKFEDRQQHRHMIRYSSYVEGKVRFFLHLVPQTKNHL